MKLRRKPRWKRKQELSAPDRFYGDDMTIHRTTTVDVETRNGQVVAVWFRCQPVAFRQSEVGADRAAEMLAMAAPRITGVQVKR